MAKLRISAKLLRAEQRALAAEEELDRLDKAIKASCPHTHYFLSEYYPGGIITNAAGGIMLCVACGAHCSEWSSGDPEKSDLFWHFRKHSKQLGGTLPRGKVEVAIHSAQRRAELLAEVLP